MDQTQESPVAVRSPGYAPQAFLFVSGYLFVLIKINSYANVRCGGAGRKSRPLLRELENLDIIQLIPQEPKLVYQPKQKLSEQFRGNISPELAADLRRQLEEMR